MINAIRTLQQVLNLLGQPLKADGIFGPKTFRALVSISQTFKADPNELGRILGLDYDILVSWSEIEHTLQLYPEHHASFVRFLISIEKEGLYDARWVYNDGVGKYRGIAQFDKSTWDSVSHLPYSTSVVVASSSIAASVALYEANLDYFSRHIGGAFTNEIAYLFHNQGASASRQFLTNGNLRWPEQSAKAKAVFARI